MYDFIKNPQTRYARAFLQLNISAVGSVTWIAITVCTSMQAKIFQGQKSFQKKAHFDFHDPECRSKKFTEKNTTEQTCTRSL